MSPIVIALTGASGSIYALRLLDVLLDAGCELHVVVSPAAALVMRDELDPQLDTDQFRIETMLPSAQQAGDVLSRFQFPALESSREQRGALRVYHHQDFHAGIASGSFLTSGMVICPCSMGTLAAIASGQSSNLIHRAADVHLKERRKLIVVPRETPLGVIQLENMARLANAGGVILPAMPGFYHAPTSMADLVDFVVARICDQLGVPHSLLGRWGEADADTGTIER
ncbi:putative aromatic acid decarboxylase [Symmachiella dynata]|uniref:UbiX family flavin prenyltransferase n=1 Tax=Symmachiella dynata TaxID=2527995 RepID=UPI00118CD5C6|nr:flavin prenyltransferase UbiX [Symmachiella dynata]QDT50580.1 putative aromatic acid decarboxylase [Symmachiella dynata]